jgi:hypothetical protein
VERHEAVERFAELFPLLKYTLEHISVSSDFDGNTRSKARGLLKNTLSPIFCYALVLLRKVLKLTKTLSVQLQATSLDLVEAYRMVSSVLNVLARWGDKEKVAVYNEARNAVPMLLRPAAASANLLEPATDDVDEEYAMAIHGFHIDGEAW